MAQRHEEKYLIDYRQYALLKARAMEVLTPDTHGVAGSYVVTSLYYDDPMDTALLEKQDGLSRHTKFRLRTYDCGDGIIRLERKVKEGILTEKQTAVLTREQLPLSGSLTGPAGELAAQMRASGLYPAVTVRYRRDAFYFPGTDLRLTFDTDLRVLPGELSALFDPTLAGIPVLDGNTVIMEIKYGSYMPNFIRHLTAVPARQLSVSKYALCREKTK